MPALPQPLYPVRGYSGIIAKTFRICFRDVPLTHNSQKAVCWAADRGIAAGYTGKKAGTYGVSDDITRGQVVMFLYRLIGALD